VDLVHRLSDIEATGLGSLDKSLVHFLTAHATMGILVPFQGFTDADVLFGGAMSLSADENAEGLHAQLGLAIQ